MVERVFAGIKVVLRTSQGVFGGLFRSSYCFEALRLRYHALVYAGDIHSKGVNCWSKVGINSLTVGWICMLREMAV